MYSMHVQMHVEMHVQYATDLAADGNQGAAKDISWWCRRQSSSNRTHGSSCKYSSKVRSTCARGPSNRRSLRVP